MQIIKHRAGYKKAYAASEDSSLYTDIVCIYQTILNPRYEKMKPHPLQRLVGGG